MSIRRFFILAVAAAAILGSSGCKTEAELKEEVEREKRIHLRLDEIQEQIASQVGAVQEEVSEISRKQANTAPKLTLRTKPVVPVARPSTPTQRQRFETIARRQSPVTRSVKSSKSRGSTRKLSLAKKHIRIAVPVSVIQKALKNAGSNPGKIDGKVGPQTISAIKDFQKKKGLKADGIVGRGTWSKLQAHVDPMK